MRKKTPKKSLLILLILGIHLTFGITELFAQRGRTQAETLEVKLGSPLPRESPWGRSLDRIAAEWNRITNGQVRLNIRHGGIEGSEAKMHLSLASDIIQAAVFTSFGLSAIDPSIMTLSMPFLIRNERELDAVMRELQRDLEARLNRGNYFILAWSKSGFVNFFSRDPVFTPDDLRRQRVATNPEASELNTAFKTMGFQIVEAEWNDMGARLNAGTVTASYQNPAAIAAFQLHSILRNMMSTNIAPVMGGIVLNQVTWRRIGDLNPRYQQELLNATRRIAEEFDTSMYRTVDGAVQTMTRAGLRVNQLTPAQEQLWFNEIERATPNLLGTVFDRDLHQRITTILGRHRAGL
jgi:TRAP-type C4-dicarboxylate transport system substrate-binding protein